ncbi:hypothetical protein [Myxosarcina sp. GI1]|uniref:hypothetical protein n=1 Tax=Myxosarcina sp. GI1 TaxID=1541065 RepID=UPI00056799F6|nr:hypothetical protein [Myxosarcina sp. GI1]
MTTTNNTNRNWTTKKLIHFSRSIGQAYCLGIDNGRSKRSADSWTTEKFIDMSRNLSSAYGVDY